MIQITYLIANNVDPDQKPLDLDLHCLERQGISVFSRTRVKVLSKIVVDNILILVYFSEKKGFGISYASSADNSYEMPNLIFSAKYELIRAS